MSSSTTTLSSTKVGDGEFTKETLREILTTMIGEFVQHKVVQESRKAELEKEGKSQDELNEQLQVSFNISSWIFGYFFILTKVLSILPLLTTPLID